LKKILLLTGLLVSSFVSCSAMEEVEKISIQKVDPLFAQFTTLKENVKNGGGTLVREMIENLSRSEKKLLWMAISGRNYCFEVLKTLKLYKYLKHSTYKVAHRRERFRKQFAHIIKSGSLNLLLILLSTNPWLANYEICGPKDTKTTPLHVAYEIKNYEKGRLLICAGANILASNTEQKTPLDVFVENHNSWR